MKSPELVLAASLLLLSAAPASWADDDEEERCSSPNGRVSYACREVIVEYDHAFDCEAVATQHGLRLIGAIPQIQQVWFEAPVGSNVDALILQIRLELGLRPDQIGRNQEFVPPECRQLTIDILGIPGAESLFLGQPALRAVRAPSGCVGLGRGVTVAVLDTGVSRSHPLLAGALTPRGIDLVDGTELADDLGNGRDDDGDGVIDQGLGHGTAVAGLIHALAPAATILPVRVLDDECQGSAFSLAKGIVEAVASGARVLNVSLGAAEDSDVVERAVEYALAHDVLLIAPGGNYLPSLGDEEDELQFPASAHGAVAVAAVDDLYRAPAWTVHAEEVALSAPGVAVIAPYRAGYARVNGSSFATAFVSGAAVVARWANPQLDRRAALGLLRATAIPVDPWNDELEGELGAGVPDISRLARVLPRPHRVRAPIAPWALGTVPSDPGIPEPAGEQRRPPRP